MVAPKLSGRAFTTGKTATFIFLFRLLITDAPLFPLCSVTLILVSTDDGSCDSHMTHLLDLVFNAMVMVIGLQELDSVANVERLKQNLKVTLNFCGHEFCNFWPFYPCWIFYAFHLCTHMICNPIRKILFGNTTKRFSQNLYIANFLEVEVQLCIWIIIGKIVDRVSYRIFW